MYDPITVWRRTGRCGSTATEPASHHGRRRVPGEPDTRLSTRLDAQLTVMLFVPAAEHPAELRTVTFRTIGLVVPALKVIVRVPAPAVIVPFVIVHVYVAPVPASGTDAVIPFAFFFTDAGAVIVADGVAFTAMF